MYLAPALDGEWLQDRQRELYTRSWNQPDYVFHKLWGLVTDVRNLSTVLARVARNRGRRTAGVDGITVAQLMAGGADTFVEAISTELTRLEREARAQLVDFRSALAGQPTEARAFLSKIFSGPLRFTPQGNRRRHAEHWCRQIAGARVHGTTRRVPRETFESIEGDDARRPDGDLRRAGLHRPGCSWGRRIQLT